MGDGVNNNPNNDSAPPDHAILANIQSRIETLEEEQAEEKKESDRQRSRQLLHTWLVTLFTGLLFITSAVSNVMMYWQAKTSEESANAATRAASAAEEALKSGRTSFEATIAEMQVQRAIAKQGADAATEAASVASAALNDNRKVFELSMRPYVTLSPAQFVGRAPTIGQPLRIRLIVRNDGRTPAVRPRGVASVVFKDSKGPFRFSPPRGALIAIADVGGAGVSMTFTSDEPLTQEDMGNAINNGRFTIVYYGEISYDSGIFTDTTPYETVRFCFYYSRSTESFGRCVISEYDTIVDPGIAPD